MFDLLSKSPVFRGIKAEEIPILLNNVNYKIKRYQKGEVIALRDDPCNNLMIVIKGSVKGEMLDFSGKIIKIEDIEAPRAIASAFLFGNNNRLPVDVVANEEAHILLIHKASVIQLFQTNQVFLNNYLNSISDRAQFLSKKLYSLSFKTIKGKLAQYILSLSKPDQTKVYFPGTQQELSEFFGVTRPALARVLREMVDKKIIEVHRKEINIVNRQALIDQIH